MIKTIIAIIVAIWAAPFVIGGVGLMLKLLFTLLLYAATGCPQPEMKKSPEPPADESIEQLFRWEEQDRAKRREGARDGHR